MNTKLKAGLIATGYVLVWPAIIVGALLTFYGFMLFMLWLPTWQHNEYVLFVLVGLIALYGLYIVINWVCREWMYYYKEYQK
jgi:hypothetical protein